MTTYEKDQYNEVYLREEVERRIKQIAEFSGEIADYQTIYEDAYQHWYGMGKYRQNTPLSKVLYEQRILGEALKRQEQATGSSLKHASIEWICNIVRDEWKTAKIPVRFSEGTPHVRQWVTEASTGNELVITNMPIQLCTTPKHPVDTGRVERRRHQRKDRQSKNGRDQL